jgi:hypothetical protein
MKYETASQPSEWERKASILPFSAGKSTDLHNSGTYKDGRKDAWILNKLPPL